MTNKQQMNIMEQIRNDFYEDKIENIEEALKKLDTYIKTNQESEAYRVRGLLYSKLQMSDKELENLNQAIQLDPNNAKAYNTRGYCYQEMNKMDLALSDFNKAIAINPKFVTPYNNKGELLRNQNRIAEAISNYNKAIEQCKDEYSPYHNRGLIYFDKTEYQKALSDFTISVKLKTDNDVAYYKIGQIYNELLEYNKAIIQFSKAIEINPNDSDYFMGRGYAYYLIEEYNEAMADYSKVIELSPDDPSAYSSRGNSYFQLKEFKKAVIDQTKAIELSPENETYYYFRGMAYHHLEEYSKANNDFTKSIELNPNYDRAYYDRASNYFKIWECDKAIKDLTKVIQLQPNSHSAYFWRGNILYENEKYDKALKDLNKAIELNSTNQDMSGYIGIRGNIYYRMDDNHKAILDFTKALQLKPDFIGALSNRGNAYAAAEQYDKAFADMKKTIEITPNDANAYHNRALLYLKLKQYDKAEVDFLKALKIQSDHPLFNTNIGLLYSTLQTHDKCQYYLGYAAKILKTYDTKTLIQKYEISQGNIDFIKKYLDLLLQIENVQQKLEGQINKLQRGNTISEDQQKEIQVLKQKKIEVFAKQNTINGQKSSPQDLTELTNLVQLLLKKVDSLEEKVKLCEQQDQNFINQGITKFKQPQNKDILDYFQSFCSHLINYLEACCILSTNLFTPNNQAAITTKSEDIIDTINSVTKSLSSVAGLIPVIGSAIEMAFSIFDFGVQQYKSQKIQNAIENISAVLMTSTVSAFERETEIKYGIITIVEKQEIFQAIEQELKNPNFEFQVTKISTIEKSKIPQASGIYWQIGIQHSLMVLRHIEGNRKQLVFDRVQMRDIIKNVIENRNDKSYNPQQQKTPQVENVRESGCCIIQ